MEKILRAFTDHPASVGETYFQHMGSALSFAGTFFIATIAAFIHAIFPFLFMKTGSEIILRLNKKMVTHRARNTPSSE